MRTVVAALLELLLALKGLKKIPFGQPKCLYTMVNIVGYKSGTSSTHSTDM